MECLSENGERIVESLSLSLNNHKGLKGMYNRYYSNIKTSSSTFFSRKKVSKKAQRSCRKGAGLRKAKHSVSVWLLMFCVVFSKIILSDFLRELDISSFLRRIVPK